MFIYYKIGIVIFHRFVYMHLIRSLLYVWVGLFLSSGDNIISHGDLFVLSWARVRRVRQGSLSSELIICGGDVRSIFLLPLVARCLETIDVCIWRKFVFMSVVVTVGMFVV